MKDVTIIYSPKPSRIFTGFWNNLVDPNLPLRSGFDYSECFVYTSPASRLMKKLTLPLN